jgi:hypothetical protein
MNLSSVKITVCALASAVALWHGVTFGATLLVVPAAPKPPTIQAALWYSFTAATNAGNIPQIWSNTATLTPQWQTASPIYGKAGFTAIACEANSGFVWSNQWWIPITALTKRHVYYRGHSTGGTNGQFFTSGNGLPVHFLTPDNQIVTAYTAANIKGSGSAYDYNIAILSNDLPASIQPIIMTDTTALNTKLGKNPIGFWPNFKPLLGTCQHNQIGTLDGSSYNPHNFYVGGDSGSPDFYIVSNSLVMVQGRTTAGWSSQMQADADALSRWAGLDPAQYQIQLFDFSQFSDF